MWLTTCPHLLAWVINIWFLPTGPIFSSNLVNESHWKQLVLIGTWSLVTHISRCGWTITQHILLYFRIVSVLENKNVNSKFVCICFCIFQMSKFQGLKPRVTDDALLPLKLSRCYCMLEITNAEGSNKRSLCIWYVGLKLHLAHIEGEGRKHDYMPQHGNWLYDNVYLNLGHLIKHKYLLQLF